MSAGQNGKGDKRRPGNEDAYRSSWDRIFGARITCDICGRFISMADLDSGRAARYLDTPDSDYSSETFVTYHAKCRARERS